MKLYYGVYKAGKEIILKVSDDVNTVHPPVTMKNTFGCIDASKSPGIAHLIVDLAQTNKATAIELNKELKHLEVR